MGGHDDLDIRIQFQHQTDELLLPFEVKADFRLIHKEDIRLVVLHQHGKEDSENLLLTSRELIRRELLTYLVEADFVGSTDDGLAGILLVLSMPITWSLSARVAGTQGPANVLIPNYNCQSSNLFLVNIDILNKLER